MKTKMTYSEAHEQLKKLVSRLEQGDIQLEELTEKVRQANELIGICEDKLRSIDDDIKDVTNTKTANKKKEKDSDFSINTSPSDPQAPLLPD